MELAENGTGICNIKNTICNKENLVTNEGKKMSMSMSVFRIFSFPQVQAYHSSTNLTSNEFRKQNIIGDICYITT